MKLPALAAFHTYIYDTKWNFTLPEGSTTKADYKV